MATKGTNLPSHLEDLNIFRDDFQLLPWKWTDKLIKRSRYLIGAAVSIYLVLFLITFFPGDESYIVEALKDYPSTLFIVLLIIIVTLLAIRWRHKIPGVFQWLWKGKILKIQDGELDEEFKKYLFEYQQNLHSKSGSLIVSLLLVGLFFSLILIVRMIPYTYQVLSLPAAIGGYYCIAMTLFIIFIFGQVIWSFFITSKSIGNLTKKFSIEIKSSHPDKCGGLKPLGDFCFDGALLLIGAGLVLFMMAITDLDNDYVLSSFAIVTLTLIIAPLSILAVFSPLWKIHQQMVVEKKSYHDRFASRVMELEEVIYTHIKTGGNVEKARTAKEKLDIIQVMHPGNRHYPVWPFNLPRTVLKVFSPQLLLGIYEVLNNITNIGVEFQKFID